MKLNADIHNCTTEFRMNEKSPELAAMVLIDKKCGSM